MGGGRNHHPPEPNISVLNCMYAPMYTLFPVQVHECVWTCVTIYLARPCTGHNVYPGAYMCKPQGNDYAPAYLS